MSEQRSDEDLTVPSFLREGSDASLSETSDPRKDPRPDARTDASPDRPDRADRTEDRPARTGAEIIGNCLRGAREEKGITVDEVFAATRIRPGLVRQIEAGDLSKCGGEVYARGHIRVMAHVVGLDAEALIREYLAVPPVDLPGGKPLTVPVRGRTQVRVIRPAAPQPRKERKADPAAAAASVAALPAAPPEPARRSTAPHGVKKITGGIGSQKGANWTAAMLAVLLGLVVVGGAQLLGGHDKSADAAAVKAPAPAPVQPPPPKPVPVVVPSGVAFKVAAVDAPSWLSVYGSDGHLLFDNMLNAGSTQSFSDGHQLVVTLGNAKAVHIQLNGKDLPPAGGDGEVVRLTVNPTGMVAG